MDLMTVLRMVLAALRSARSRNARTSRVATGPWHAPGGHQHGEGDSVGGEHGPRHQYPAAVGKHVPGQGDGVGSIGEVRRELGANEEPEASLAQRSGAAGMPGKIR